MQRILQNLQGRHRVLVVALFAGWMTSAFAASSEPPEPAQTLLKTDARDGWDKQAAAKYLDDRMDLWFARAKKLRTGNGTTSCVACHTVVPYTLARPALRKAAGVNTPTAQEAKLLEQTRLRVETYGSHEPLYDKQQENSRGTEAVLNLLILAGEDARQGCQVPSEPARKALEELWKEQRPDGAWNWVDSGLEPYESKGSVYFGATVAAVAIGTVPGGADQLGAKASGHIAELRAYLNEKYSEQNLYNRIFALLASTRLEGVWAQKQRDSLLAELEHIQKTDGGWSLQSLGPWKRATTSGSPKTEAHEDTSPVVGADGYATGLIVYTFRRAGVSAEQPVLKKAIDWLKANQRDTQIDQNHWKCWRAYSLNQDREHGGESGEAWKRMFMSDSATAFAALALLPLEL